MIDTKIPRAEHPNPQLVRERWENLNGEWQFLKDPSVSGKERRLFEADEFPSRITVPFCMESELSGIGDKDFCDCVWYRREVDISEDWLCDGKRVLLHIGACDYRTDVYVNAIRTGSHRGGSVSFEFDITEALKVGKNVITVRAEDKTRSREQPLGKQSSRYESHSCFYTRTTGIWQTVWLESVPREYIKYIKYRPNVEDTSVTISLETVCGKGINARAEVFWNGKSVGEGASVATEEGCDIIVKLSELHLWELGRGGLYDVEISFGNDKVKSYFGMRTLSLDDSALVINGVKVFQRLVLDQGFYPDGIFTAPDEQSLIDDIKRSMECGFNGARLHQKVFEPLFLYHCDRLGYMVWGEFGNWGLDMISPIGWKGFVSEWIEIVKRDMNHPSIIGWCPFNETHESGGQDDELVAYGVQLTKLLDPTRPVIDSSGWIHVEGATDIMDWHDYDQDPESLKKRYIDVANGIPIVNKKLARFPLFPRFISEYGGIKWDISSDNGAAWGYGDAPKTEQEFLDRFKGLTEALMFNPYITGICYTQLTDVEQETNGLFTYDRKAKFDTKFFNAVLSQKAAIEYRVKRIE